MTFFLGRGGDNSLPPQKKIFSKIFFKNIQFGGGKYPPQKNFLKNIYFGGGNYPPQNGLGGENTPPPKSLGVPTAPPR